MRGKRATVYVYNKKTRNVVAVYEGDSKMIHLWAEREFQWNYDIEKFGVTFEPAFGFANGLKNINKNAKWYYYD